MIASKNGSTPQKTGAVNVARYVRVSTDKQADKEDGSLDTQLDRLNSLVEYRCKQGENWLIAEKLIEGEKDGKRHGKSAKNMDRPALQKLLELARARLIDVVAVTKLDRVSRSLSDFVKLIEELDRHEVKLVSLKENIDLTSPAGRLQTYILIALAQYERELTSSRVKDKVAWRVERGLPIGPPPTGYRMEGKLYGVDEPYAGHVRAADALYLEHESADALVREFRRRGYRTKKGHFYTKQVICRMLRSPIYVGKQRYEGKLYDAQWKPIRSWDAHQTIQKMMDRNDRRHRSPKRQPKDYVYLLQGLLRCGACGHKMSPKPAVGRNGAYYPYYFCGGAEKSCGTACDQRYVPAEAIDRAVLEFMKQLNLKPERIKAFADRANEFASGTIAKLREDLERVGDRLIGVRSKLSGLADAIAEGGRAAMLTLREKLEALEAERAELETDEGRLKNELAAEQKQEIAVQDQIQTLALFHDLVAKNEDKPDRIKSLLPRFVDYVVWHAAEKGEGQMEVALFPDPVALAPDAEVAGDGRCFVGGSQVVDLMGFEPTTSAMRVPRSPN